MSQPPNQEDAMIGLAAMAELGKRLREQGSISQGGPPQYDPTEHNGAPVGVAVPMQGQPQPMPQPADDLGLLKPKTQVVQADRIVWTWKTIEGEKNFDITAIYFKKTKNWNVILHDEASGTTAMLSEQAKSLGQVILSAALWENMWRQCAGEFLDDGGDE